MSTISYLEAGKRAVREEMQRDATVWALGEDLGRGGVFGQYKGLIDEFGPARIADTPISEACIMGAAVGAAMTGTRPIVEMRFSDFALCAIDELVNQAAKARFMFGGQMRVPMGGARADGDVALVRCAAFAIARILVHPYSRPRGRRPGDAGG